VERNGQYQLKESEQFSSNFQDKVRVCSACRCFARATRISLLSYFLHYRAYSIKYEDNLKQRIRKCMEMFMACFRLRVPQTAYRDWRNLRHKANHFLC